MATKTIIAGALLICVVCIGVVALTDAGPSQRSSLPRTGTTVDAIPPGPRLSDRQINRQDRVTKRQARREAQVFDQRPLLSELPTVFEGVSFDIGGLAEDGRTTIIAIDANGQGRRRALLAYRALRRKVGDRSEAYQPEVRP